ncbi:MAG: FKBP-type peptidyl-prolyl cis-trans isomerase [Candidatus Thiodiazotropha lotti]|uniref:Peptidyl-prolyl cis-trans isomerase n=1 Tax=Candidatus Thiodiazotropha endoloripes TaxID=1818881 RepID=A0A1E2UMR6_9GAMM|nr:FKBP-type peptidyl-prolyl cis-trans isomerase [Candidatus Thiodiazotropha endoloripes]MCG7900143.1 FKBP-type peptidyl-prolyl cis-trans isomerase [Candidatus Thiodiazotropha weberae]MCG7991447.1 FKBP-type peptidyl-prolyl cis-trans isomerase [Candidatus Thiodiazotropha lotti]MCG7902310.1 FKBP-type peptidyl-prolyl cis-trans isomerase [Candidatus Thiodiazotropha weberae]MCG7912636.1 FKBP-type peptidyl-prolyl cis-trans isomerase [Candidatus Thiodiazotropha weberae]MCG8000928.1 FKBP-type peptidyl
MSKETIKSGKFVSLAYTIQDMDGNVLEQSDLPVSYIHGGETELIGGMDQAVLGKTQGEEVTMTISPENGFGDYDPNLIITDEIENVPAELRQLGAEVQMQNDAGDVKSFYVTKIEAGLLTVDGNHPLAGKSLQVKVKILQVRDATQEDVLQVGMPGQSQTIN